MKFVFPNLGNLSILLCALMRELGVPFTGPLPTNNHTAELGAKYAPADACMPMKIVLGNFIEGYENGADTALFLGGYGPCCFGYFAEIFQLIFDQNGIKMKVITLETDFSGISEGVKLLRAVTEQPLWFTAGLLKKGFAYTRILDKYEQCLYQKQAEISDESERKKLAAFRESWQKRLHNAVSLDEVRQLAAAGIKRINTFKSDTRPRIKIGIVGDIYSVIDPFMNHQIQSVLADMGAYSERNMSLSIWIEDKLKLKRMDWKPYADLFLSEDVGGFARETVGSAALWADNDFDGIIEIYPLNCMPESVAKTILPAVSKTYSKPIMSLIVDEMSGKAGYMTRLEAFTQMLIRRKEAENEGAVSRN